MIFLNEEDLRKKLKILKDSFDSGFIKEKEYKQEKEKIENELNKLKKEKPSIKPTAEKKSEKNISDKILIVSVIIIIIIFFIAFFGFKYLSKSEIKTIDELHLLNMQGKLKPEQGYIFKGFSFVKLDTLWYTQIQVENRLYNIPIHFGPRDLKDIPIEGSYNATLFDLSQGIYMTFDPLGNYLTYVALATGEIDQTLTKAFGKYPVAACIKNETEACKTRPIINCTNTKAPLIYVKEADETKVILNDNCLIVQGKGMEIVKAADRLLMRLYDIM